MKYQLIREATGTFSLQNTEVSIENTELLISPTTEMSIENSANLYADLTSILCSLEGINSKGYVNTFSISETPVLKDYLSRYCESKQELSLNEERILMTWLYRLLNLNLYSICLSILNKMGETSKEYDIKTDMEMLGAKFYVNISPSIRDSLKLKGITINKKIYCGFDTEYKNLDLKRNKLLSSQFAVNSKINLVIPYVSDYSLSGMNTESGENYKINPYWFDQEKINYTLMESDIRDHIEDIRLYKGYTLIDEKIKELVKQLLKSEVSYYKSSDRITFSFPRSSVKTYFKDDDLENLDMNTIVKIGENLSISDLSFQESSIQGLLERIKETETYSLEDIAEWPDLNTTTNSKIIKDEPLECLKDEAEKGPPLSNKLKSGSRSKFPLTPLKGISITKNKSFHLIGHLTQADLCFLKDFNEIKEHISIVQKSLSTLGKSKLIVGGNRVIFHDTMLLAPGGKKSLSKIGPMYGLPKLELLPGEAHNMEFLMKTNAIKFKEYALRDPYICLIHAQALEESHFNLHKSTIPITLSSLGGSNLRKAWLEKGYGGYQISKDTLIGDSRKTTTPKGLFELGDTGLALSQYISNYKGGRNESFMIGKDNGQTQWKDYDLTSAYTTAMCMLGDPNYKAIRTLSESEILDLSDKELLYSYTIIKVSFEFPETTKYPSIPCFADQTTTVYPRSGTAQLNGWEYILARRQDCKLEILGGTLIPYNYKSREDWIDILNGKTNKDGSWEIPPTKNTKLKTKIEKLVSSPLNSPEGIPSYESWKETVGTPSKGGVPLTESELITLYDKEKSASDPSQWVSKGFASENSYKDWIAYKSRVFPVRSLFDRNKFTNLYMDLPFHEIISDLQSKRREHPKGSLQNILYKEMGNSLYGSVTKGVSNKLRYDLSTGKTVRMEANDLSNPIMASWITASVRSIMGTLLEEVSASGGKAVSVTTDGFITDTEELETRFVVAEGSETLSGTLTKSADPIYKAYSEIRETLSGDPSIMELHASGKGLLSATTRVQVSSGMGQRATTGYQHHGESINSTVDLLKEGLTSPKRTVCYVSSRLRSAKDIVKDGGHVTMQYRDQDFRLLYNNCRKVTFIDQLTGLYDSVPWNTVEEALSSRSLSNIVKSGVYQQGSSTKSDKGYKSYLELGIRAYIKEIFRKGWYKNRYKDYQSICDYINIFFEEYSIKIRNPVSPSYISSVRLNSIGKVQSPRKFVDTLESQQFVEYLRKDWVVWS